jgi:hypothetical protein
MVTATLLLLVLHITPAVILLIPACMYSSICVPSSIAVQQLLLGRIGI